MAQQKKPKLLRTLESQKGDIPAKQTLMGDESTELSATTVKKKLKELEVAIHLVKHKIGGNILELGGFLQQAHDLHARPGVGDFCQWVEDLFGFTPQSARNYMQVFRVFGETDCKSLLQTTTAETLYFLARKSTPSAAIKEVLRLVKKGQNITLDGAKKIVDKHKPKKIPSETSAQSAEVGDTEDGTGEPDSADDTDAGFAQDGEAFSDDDDTAATADEQSCLTGFATEVRIVIENWRIICRIDELPGFADELRRLADELENAAHLPFDDLKS